MVAIFSYVFTQPIPNQSKEEDQNLSDDNRAEMCSTLTTGIHIEAA